MLSSVTGFWFSVFAVVCLTLAALAAPVGEAWGDEPGEVYAAPCDVNCSTSWPVCGNGDCNPPNKPVCSNSKCRPTAIKPTCECQVNP